MAELRTLGLSGFDRDEEAAFRQVFDAAAVPGWVLVAEQDANALVIDFDSMYGQMGWLKAQGTGKPIAACTVGMRADTDFLLRRPLTVEGLAELLARMESAVRPRHVTGQQPAVGGARPARPAAAADGAAPRPRVTGPQPAVPAVAPPPSARPAATVAVPPAAATTPATTASAPAATAAAATPKRLLDYLDPARLPGPVRLGDAEPVLALDPHAFTYAGGAALKPLMVHCAREIAPAEWRALSPAEYTALKTGQGGTQPLTRLRWLAALCTWNGALCPELLGATRFKLSKWPQSEREFPKHFKIATTLLKHASTLEELAAASGASRGEVADFINACHAIGMIEAEGLPEAAPAPADPAARGSLMDRLRGR
jgi:hypothetical protein